ncbi:Uncharacterized protein Fot_19440 [Forsythia ovata]|uniref:Uncharacterized protein n=1 Tax=Forsythia ovata TaxID=205694 RepID=A0ABD1VL19_9LAMI
MDHRRCKMCFHSFNLFMCLFANLYLFSVTIVLNPDASIPSLESVDTTNYGHLPSIVGESSSKDADEKGSRSTRTSIGWWGTSGAAMGCRPFVGATRSTTTGCAARWVACGVTWGNCARGSLSETSMMK